MFHKIIVEPLMSQTILTMSLNLSGPRYVSVALLSMQDQKALRFNPKYLNFAF